MLRRLRISAARYRRVVFNEETRRPWTAAAVGGAVFTPLFWSGVAFGLGRLSLDRGETAGAYPAAAVWMYFLAVLVVGPLLAHTGGYVLDRYTAMWRRDDAVVAFAGLGLVLAIAAIALLVSTAPGGGAFAPALWLFGLPLVVTTAVTRLVIDQVLESKRWTVAAASVALAPAAVATLLLLGLWVSQGAEQVPEL